MIKMAANDVYPPTGSSCMSCTTFPVSMISFRVCIGSFYPCLYIVNIDRWSYFACSHFL